MSLMLYDDALQGDIAQNVFAKLHAAMSFEMNIIH